jgi:hypothetical protein
VPARQVRSETIQEEKGVIRSTDREGKGVRREKGLPVEKHDEKVAQRNTVTRRKRYCDAV